MAAFSLRAQSNKPFFFELDSARFVASGPQRCPGIVNNFSPNALTVLSIPPQTRINGDWIIATLSTILEADTPLRSGFDALDWLEEADIRYVLFVGDRFTLRDGPYVRHDRSLWPAFRLHDETQGAFMAAVVPYTNDPTAAFCSMSLPGSGYQILGIATPPRCSPSPTQPLRGLRFAVKDAYRVRGLKTSLSNRAYLSLSPPAVTTASIVSKLIGAGCSLVGMTKLSNMIGREEPTEAIDYHAPFNPRADGYQSPAGSSSGSAAAVVAYPWLDFPIGTDTTGSGRRPALVNGVFQMRPTHDSVPLYGMVPVFAPWDAPVLYTRELALLKPLVSTWLEPNSSDASAISQKPPAIMYPEDFWPVDNQVQMQLVDDFLTDLATTFGVNVQKSTLASAWDDSPPSDAGAQGIKDYLANVYVDTNFHDYYHLNTKEFREEFLNRFQKQPYVPPFIRWKWDLGKQVTKAQRDEGMRRLEIYKTWLLERVLRQKTHQGLLILPIANVEPNYRDVYPPPVSRPVGFDPLIISPVLGAPDIVVPIGEFEYKARVTGLTEYLPVAVNIVGPPGSDMFLIDAIQRCLEESGRSMKVVTGSRMFETGSNNQTL